MRTMSRFSVYAVCLCARPALLAQTDGPIEPFDAKPYLQLGDSPKLRDKESLVLVGARAWRTAEFPTSTLVSAPPGKALVAGQNGAKKDAAAVTEASSLWIS